MRALNLHNHLIASSHDSTIISSNFNHSSKSFRLPLLSSPYYIDINTRTILINSPGYRSNISLSRLYDHLVLSINLLRFLLSKDFSHPDLSFVGYPPIEWAFVALFFSKINRVPVVLDIKDLWPDLFLENVSFWKRLAYVILFSPYKVLAHFSLALADYISVPTPDYAPQWLSTFRRRKPSKIIVAPLVCDFKEKVDISASSIRHSARSFTESAPLIITFLGTLNLTSFDFTSVFGAARILSADSSFPPHFKFFIVGDGPSLTHLKDQVSSLGLSLFFEFTGWLDSSPAASLLSRSHLGLAPYTNSPNFRGHFPNKMSDYLQFGLPVLTSLQGAYPSECSARGILFSYTTHCELAHFIKEYTLLSSEQRLSRSSLAHHYWVSNFFSSSVYTNLVRTISSFLV